MQIYKYFFEILINKFYFNIVFYKLKTNINKNMYLILD